MFEKRRCTRCNSNLKDGWKYCPKCGTGIDSRSESPFDVFEDMDREFERIDKAVMPRFVELPRLGMPNAKGGISITIKNVPGRMPEVRVSAPGGYGNAGPKRVPARVSPSKNSRVPRTTEEPEMKVQNAGGAQVMSIELPGVGAEDIEVRRLEQSLEVKAFAGDKAYFKLIPLPANSEVSRREFKDGVLRVEVRRTNSKVY